MQYTNLCFAEIIEFVLLDQQHFINKVQLAPIIIPSELYILYCQFKFSSTDFLGHFFNSNMPLDAKYLF